MLKMVIQALSMNVESLGHIGIGTILKKERDVMLP